MVDGLFLDRLQQLHIDDFQFFLIWVKETWSHFASDIDSRSNEELSIEFKPIISKEGKFSRTVIVFQCYQPPGFVVLACPGLYGSDDTTQSNILTVY